MFCEIRVRVDGQEKWVDARKFFDYMITEYSKVKYGGKSVNPYPDRVKSFYNNIPKDLMEEWKKAYPNVNIDEEVNKCRVWLLSNTSKAKKDFKRFTNNWLSRAMGYGGSIPVQLDQKIDKQIKQHQEYMKNAEQDAASEKERKEILQGVMSNLKWKKKTKQ